MRLLMHLWQCLSTWERISEKENMLAFWKRENGAFWHFVPKNLLGPLNAPSSSLNPPRHQIRPSTARHDIHLSFKSFEINPSIPILRYKATLTGSYELQARSAELRASAMVLDNASASNSSDSFADSAPSDDADLYSDSQPGSSYQIDTSRFSKPIPIIGRLLGYNDQFYSIYLNKKIETATPIIGRPLSQEEVNAYAYHLSKQISIFSYGAPAGFAAGLWRAYDSRNTYRFPFYRPNLENFQPDRFPPGLGFIKGFNAMACWHAARTSAYVIVGIFCSRMIFGSYAATVAAIGELSDPRLKEITAVIQSRAQQKKGSLPGMQRRPEAERQLPKGGRPAGTHYDSRESSPQDDASPTRGMFGEENTAGSPESSGGSMSGSTQNGGQWPTRVAPLPSPKQTEESNDQPFDAWDDASPTGGQGMGDSTASTPQGSAWDRLRRGEKPNPIPRKPGARPQTNQSPWSRQQNETQKEQRQESTIGDSFAFSKSEEERTYAKEEAQKEFDARVERERRGGDFSKGGGDQRRW
jgi:hypothetical protein